MHMHNLNWLAILVAAISTMVVGFLWYSRLLFAKPWMREMGYDPNDKAKVEEMQKRTGSAYGGRSSAVRNSSLTLSSSLPRRSSTSPPATFTSLLPHVLGCVSPRRRPF